MSPAPRSFREAGVAACLLTALVLPRLAGASAPDWNAVAGVEEIFAITTNEDGSVRETTIWLVVVDGQGYIRTSRSTTWGKNVARDPDIVVRIEGTDHPVRVSFIEDERLREQVIRAFREKYGRIDGLLGIFRGTDPRIMRLDPRAGD